jgi:predicted O-methyltransferase YrrM
MAKAIAELTKLARITRMILTHYFKALSGNKESREFFTGLYLGHVWSGRFSVPEKALPVKKVEELLPGINRSFIQTYSAFDTLRENHFDEKRGYLQSPFELTVLCALAKFFAPKNVFEFGTYRGWTIANLALNLPEGSELTTLDIFTLPIEDEFIGRVFAEKKIKRLVGDSRIYDFSTLNGSIDFIFIDADHSKEAVERDSRNALAMLSARGTILWHDYNPLIPGVVEHLEELQNEIKIFQIFRTSIAIYSRDPRIVG